ncbi:MAG: SurA N-terminal domain-containing protein [Bacteroidetes bacterium]|nr:SurA N-terminal domain-containing protein [Bacteroidota bacterium]
MAIINKLRKSGWVFVVILAALALFVLSDFISSFQRGGGGVQDPIVGEINGIDIHYSEYENDLKLREQNIAQNKKGEGLTEDDRTQAATSAWDDMFRKYVVNSEYEKLGIEASNEELKEQLFGDNPNQYIRQYFTNEKGEFSSANVRNWYNQVYKTNPEAQLFFNSLKDAVVSSIQGDKYSDMILKGINVTNFDALQDYLQQSKTVTGSVIGLQLASIADDQVSFTEDELRSYYNKNKEKYKLEDSRDLEYVSWSIAPSSFDSLDAKNAITELIKEFKETDNDSVFTSMNTDIETHGMYKELGQSINALDNNLLNAKVGDVLGPFLTDNAYLIAKLADRKEGTRIKYKYNSIVIPRNWSTKDDSLKTVAEAKSFLEYMKITPYKQVIDSAKVLGYLVQGDKDGYIPWNYEETIDPTIVEEIRKGKKGDFFLKGSMNGITLVKIDENSNNETFLVYEIIKQFEPSMNTINEVYSEANQFRAKVADGKDGAFNKVIEEEGLAKRIAHNVLPSGGEVPGIDNPKEIIKWAFDENRKVNDISEVFSIGNRQIVVNIAKISKEGIGSFDEVKQQVIEDVIKEKKFELLEAKLFKAKEGKPNMIQTAIEVSSVAHDFSNLTFKTNSFEAGRNEFMVQGVALGIKSNVISNPIRGQEGCFLVFVSDESNPEIPEDLANRKGMVYSSTTQVLEAKIVNSLKALANIKDNRNKYF